MLKIKVNERQVVLGLSDMNLQKLKEGLPIKINLKDLDMQDIEIFIFAGKDEHTMAEQFKDGIGPKTTVKIDPKLNFG